MKKILCISRFANLSMCILSCLALGTLLSACSIAPQGNLPPQPTAQNPIPTTATLATIATNTPSPSPKFPADSRKIQDAIQQSLDLYARAYSENSEDLLGQAVDQAPPFWRFVTTRFTNYQKSFGAGQGRFSYEVKEIKPRDFGFVEARIQTRNGSESHWLFHEVKGKWVVAEPTAEQMGEPRITERSGFIFKTYAWADATNDQIIRLMENARARVLKVLGKVPDENATVWIKPIYAVSPFDDPFAVASYSTGFRGQDNLISIFSPHSYGYSFYDPSAGWQANLETILTHEYAHMTHKRSFGNAGGFCTWISEGLAEFAAGDFSRSEVRRAVNSGNIIPLVDDTSPVYKQDLNHMILLTKDRGLAYGFAVSVVSFIVENYGGLDGFWKLARACNGAPDFDTALQQGLGVPFAKFDREWRAWLLKY